MKIFVLRKARILRLCFCFARERLGLNDRKKRALTISPPEGAPSACFSLNSVENSET
jgi:hypothetical protein